MSLRLPVLACPGNPAGRINRLLRSNPASVGFRGGGVGWEAFDEAGLLPKLNIFAVRRLLRFLDGLLIVGAFHYA